ncbi:receptor tyrosine-protein kinase erbB-4-like [Pangasianodon hypophthalmus]|uniref:receptor tyrosine-protein kinase erbB-4-like n=1 Tax=Pangasianodon hypophthalmus TaxID=310915 RepID=UPI000EFF1993|nr:receptor tyrosine-protein kinase erbB-4-like [Pangasianodon hypophthalmus]
MFSVFGGSWRLAVIQTIRARTQKSSTSNQTGHLAVRFHSSAQEQTAYKGFDNKLSTLSDLDQHYYTLCMFYENCEVLVGNLEITNTEHNCNLDFLKISHLNP